MKRALVLGLSIAATLALPLAASARDADDHNWHAWDHTEHRIVGRVVESRPYNLQLNYGPHIFLHNGTVIRPRGLTLRDGMLVRVTGHRTGDGFAADEIDLVRHHDGDDREGYLR